MSIHSHHIAFIGGGNMATAIAQGLHAQGGYTLSVTDPSPATTQVWQALFNAGTSNIEPHAIVLAVKPQQFDEAARALKTTLSHNTLIISVMAGIPIARISVALDGHAAILRSMPNTPAKIAQGITAWFAAPACSSAQTKLANDVLSSIGQTVELDEESQIDAVTALSGSGPAYAFYIAQAMIEAGQALGLPLASAKQLALQTLKGSAELALQANEDLDTLRTQVTSKGGTTAAALAVFKAHNLDQTIAAAIRSAHQRAQELAK